VLPIAFNFSLICLKASFTFINGSFTERPFIYSRWNNTFTLNLKQVMMNNKNFKSMATGMFLVIATFVFAITNHSVADFSISNLVLMALATSSVIFLAKAIKDDQERDSDQIGQF